MSVDREVLILNQKGTWIADGEEISHLPTCRLFFRSLKRDEKGWFLEIGHETKYVQVEDTAFFVLRIQGSPEEGFELELSDGRREKLDPNTLRYRPGRLTCRTGIHEARFLSVPYMEILRDLEEDHQGYFLKIEGHLIRLASHRDPSL